MEPINEILQPADLGGIGKYWIKAAVVSPTINVMCASLARDEIEPLVYTSWPSADKVDGTVPGQEIGSYRYQDDIPRKTADEFLNATAVDDVFRWGKRYGRTPPVFRMVRTAGVPPFHRDLSGLTLPVQWPMDYNMVTNTSLTGEDAMYILAKPAHTANYTLCELRSWTSVDCSTELSVGPSPPLSSAPTESQEPYPNPPTRDQISGTSGGQMRARCTGPSDANSYLRHNPSATARPSSDWKNLVDQWRLAIDLNGGTTNANSSNTRILTSLALAAPALPRALPSLAEALAVLASSALTASARRATFRHAWAHGNGTTAAAAHQLAAPGARETFAAEVCAAGYASSHRAGAACVFYAVLAAVVVVNGGCLWCWVRDGLVRNAVVVDFTDPAHAFVLALNSPPSGRVAGACGGGPGSAERAAPWRVRFDEGGNH